MKMKMITENSARFMVSIGCEGNQRVWGEILGKRFELKYFSDAEGPKVYILAGEEEKEILLKRDPAAVFAHPLRDEFQLFEEQNGDDITVNVKFQVREKLFSGKTVRTNYDFEVKCESCLEEENDYKEVEKVFISLTSIRAMDFSEKEVIFSSEVSV